MSMKQNVSFLKRCGLTLDKLAEVACASDPREDGDPPIVLRPNAERR